MQVERDLEEIEALLWGEAARADPPRTLEPDDDVSTGAAAGFALVAFTAFLVGLGVAALVLL